MERFFFRLNGHEERVQCETAHYRDGKTTSCLPKISFKTVLSDPLEMPIVSVRFLIVNRRFLCTNSLIRLTYCSSVYDIVKIDKITFSRLENTSVTM